MKRIVSVVLALVCVLTMTAVADQIDWGNASLIYDRTGTTVPDGSSYLIEMWYAGGNGAIDPFTSPGDDTAISGATASFNLGPGSDGYFFTSIDPSTLGIADGALVYTRIFDAATSGSATYWVDVGSVATVQDSTSPATPWAYDPGGTAANGSDWQAVPEPATLALFGIGMVAVGARKVLRRKD